MYINTFTTSFCVAGCEPVGDPGGDIFHAGAAIKRARSWVRRAGSVPGDGWKNLNIHLSTDPCRWVRPLTGQSNKLVRMGCAGVTIRIESKAI